MADTNNADIKKLPFERAIEELESIVKRLEEGKVPLEESVAIYERGGILKKRCEELVQQAEDAVAGDPTTLARTKIARMSLDFAIMERSRLEAAKKLHRRLDPAGLIAVNSRKDPHAQKVPPVARTGEQEARDDNR